MSTSVGVKKLISGPAAVFISSLKAGITHLVKRTATVRNIAV